MASFFWTITAKALHLLWENFSANGHTETGKQSLQHCAICCEKFFLLWHLRFAVNLRREIGTYNFKRSDTIDLQLMQTGSGSDYSLTGSNRTSYTALAVVHYAASQNELAALLSNTFHVHVVHQQYIADFGQHVKYLPHGRGGSFSLLFA